MVGPERAALKVGISHHEPCGQVVFWSAEPFVPDVSCQKGRKDMLRLDAQGSPQSTKLPTFLKGDEVSLAKGTYEGTLGTFLNFKDDDPNWADILEQDSQVRPHPVEWLQHHPAAANSDHETIQAPAYKCR